MEGMNDTKDTYLMKGESTALTFLLIYHTHLSSLKRFIYRGIAINDESMRDEMQLFILREVITKVNAITSGSNGVNSLNLCHQFRKSSCREREYAQRTGSFRKR